MARYGRSQPINVYYSDNLVAFSDDLAGQGTISATGSGSLVITAVIDGHGDAAAGSTPNLGIAAGHPDLLGRGTAAASGTGAILETARLTGTGANTAGSNAPLVIGTRIAGKGTAAATGVAEQATLPPTAPVVGYQTWYDASDPTTIVGAIQWNDKSGNGFNLSASGTNQPASGLRALNTRNVLEFDGVTDELTGGVVYGEPWTIFAVVLADRVDTGTIVGNDSAVGLWALSLIDGHAGASRSGVFIGGVGSLPAVVAGTATVITTTANQLADTYLTRVNGGAWGASSDLVFGAHDFGADVGNTPDGPPYDGVIGELITYPVLLSDADCALVEAYLTAKWVPTITQVLAGQGTSAATSAAVDLVFTKDFGPHVGAAVAAADLPLVIAGSLAGDGEASSAGTGDLTVGPFPGYLAWYDATDLSTIIVSFGIVAAWGDKSEHGYDLGAASIATAPSTGQGTVATTGTAVIFNAVQDTNPITDTITDTGHMDTIWDRGHTDTLVDSP